MRTTESIRLPPTVQAVLAARIDRLPMGEKSLLQSSAVFGTEVPFGLLQLIAGRPEELLRRSLRHLQAAEFVYEAHLFPELVYMFKHALTHEGAYGSLLQERRRTAIELCHLLGYALSSLGEYSRSFTLLGEAEGSGPAARRSSPVGTGVVYHDIRTQNPGGP